MKKSFLIASLVSIVTWGIGSSASAATVGWNFGTSAANPSASTITLSEIASAAISATQINNNGTTTLLTTTSPSGVYAGASAQFNAGAAARIGALDLGATGSAGFEFTLTPAALTSIEITGISFGSRSTSTGPKSYSLRSSADSYASSVADGTMLADSVWALESNSGLSVTFTSPITFRVYGFDGTGSPTTGTANWRIDDVVFTYTATVVPEPTGILLGGIGLIGLVGLARARRNRA